MELYYFLGKKKRERKSLKKSSDLLSIFQGKRNREIWVQSLENFPIHIAWGAPKGLKRIFWQSIPFRSNYLGESDFLSSIFYQGKGFEYGLIGFCHLRVEEPIFYHNSKIQWFSIGSFFSEQHLSQNEEIFSLFHQGRHWFSNLFQEKNTAFFLGKEVYSRFFPFRYSSFLVGLSLSERNRFWLGISGYQEKGKVEWLEGVLTPSSSFSISSTSYEEENGDLLLPSKLFMEEDGDWIFEEVKKSKKILGSSVDNLFRKFFHPFRDEMKLFDFEEVAFRSWKREEKNLSSMDGKKYLSYFPFFFYSSEYLWNLREEFLWDKFYFIQREVSPFFYLVEKIKKEEIFRSFRWVSERKVEKKEIWFEENSYYSPRKDPISFHSMNLRQTYQRHSLEGEKKNYD